MSDYFKFAFVRNSWDRAVSQISYLRSKTGTSLFTGADFKEDIRIYCNMKTTVRGHHLGACQLDYLKNLSGEMSMEFVGRFESLLEDFNKVSKILGIVDVPNIPHLNKAKRTACYSTYYNAESAGWIRERFAEDIEFFNYEFEERE